jgi:hypothetical protein
MMIMDERSLTMQLMLLIAFFPALAMNAVCAGWALWRLHRRPRESWLLLGALGLNACQFLLLSSLLPLLLLLMSAVGAVLSGEAFSLALSLAQLALSLTSWWLIVLGLFGPTPFQRPAMSADSVDPNSRIESPVMMAAFWPIALISVNVLGMLLVWAMLIGAARQQRSVRPRTARWTLAIVGLNALGNLLPWVWSLLGRSTYLPQSNNLESALADPQIWTLFAQCWLGAVFPAAEQVIISYLVLEQPDLPPLAGAREPNGCRALASGFPR